MNTEQNKLPLWKELNKKRTQGEWKLSNNIFLHIESGGKWINQLSDIETDKNISILSKEWDDEQLKASNEKIANAQYTALAVNNFAAVVEALENLLSSYKADFKNITGADLNDTEAVKKAKQVLNNI